MFALGGFTLLMSGGNSGKVSEGKEMMTNAIIGLLIVLSAWLIVNTIFKTVVGGSISGNWYEIKCVPNPSLTADPAKSNVVASGGAGGGTGTITGGKLLDTTAVVQKYGSQISTYCQNSTIPNCESVVSALIAKESQGNPSATSPKGALGLMQLMPENGGVACQSGDQTCINNQIQKGIQMLEADYKSNGGSVSLTLIQYNGGKAATAPSGCCPDGMAYQCPYDCGQSKTYKQCTGLSDVCTANTGFKETRNYVNDICATIGGC
jgi:hypothetical protein